VFKTVVADFVLIKRPQMTSFDFPTTMPMMVLMHKPIHKPSLALDPWREKKILENMQCYSTQRYHSQEMLCFSF